QPSDRRHRQYQPQSGHDPSPCSTATNRTSSLDQPRQRRWLELDVGTSIAPLTLELAHQPSERQAGVRESLPLVQSLEGQPSAADAATRLGLQEPFTKPLEHRGNIVALGRGVLTPNSQTVQLGLVLRD